MRAGPRRAQKPDSVFSGGLIDIAVPHEDPLADLYECVRFGMNPLWAEYYRETAVTRAEREYVIRASLATVARDIPIVLAFSLLLGARGALRTRTIERSRLNMKRLPEGRRPLLDHIEVDSELIGDDRTPSAAEDGRDRAPKRALAPCAGSSVSARRECLLACGAP